MILSRFPSNLAASDKEVLLICFNKDPIIEEYNKKIILILPFPCFFLGLDDLCGFQIQINSLSKVLRTDCIQLNSKVN